MTPDELLREDEKIFQPVKIALGIVQTTNLIFQIIDTCTRTYRNGYFYYVVWACWLLVTFICFAAWKFKKPCFYRVAHHIMWARNMLPMFNVGDAKKMEDLGSLI